MHEGNAAQRGFARRVKGGGIIRYVPNILTVVRIACAALLPLTSPLSPAFFALYALGGATDMLDGFIARKYRCAGPLGAALDSVADFAFSAAALWSLIPALPWENWMLFWAGAIALVRLMALAVGWVKFRTPAFLHTYANKAAGAALFLAPFLIPLTGLAAPAAIGCAVASLASAEELAILLKSASLDRNAPGLFMRRSISEPRP